MEPEAEETAPLAGCAHPLDQSALNQTTPFQKAVLKTIDFLEKAGIDYFVLGGLAVGVLGEPRFTGDLDLDIFIAKTEIPGFLKKVKREGFRLNMKEALDHVEQFGTFRLLREKLPIDVILASTELEQAALRRRKRLALFGRKMWFPSPEDLILLKIIPGRPKDLMDAESIVLRYKGKLEIAYLEKWTRTISEEAEDFRVVHCLRKLLRL